MGSEKGNGGEKNEVLIEEVEENVPHELFEGEHRVLRSEQ